MIATISLNPPTRLGSDLGPNFYLTANVGTTNPSTLSLNELITGSSVSMSQQTTTMSIQASGSCQNTIILYSTSVGSFSANLGTGYNNEVKDILNYSGQLLAVGNFTNYNGTSSIHVSRLNQDLKLDTTFNSGTGFSGSGVDITVGLVDASGKILVAATNAVSYNGSSIPGLVRLNSNGTLDTSFSAGSIINGAISSIIENGDGKYLIAGAFTSYSGSTVNRIVRINNNGSIDSNFNIGSGFNNNVNIIQKGSDNYYYCGGNFTNYSGSSYTFACRIDSNGLGDTTWKPNVSSQISTGLFSSNNRFYYASNTVTPTVSTQIRYLSGSSQSINDGVLATSNAQVKRIIEEPGTQKIACSYSVISSGVSLFRKFLSNSTSDSSFITYDSGTPGNYMGSGLGYINNILYGYTDRPGFTGKMGIWYKAGSRII